MQIDVSPIDEVAYPEILLPSQFFGAVRGRAALQCGECRLLIAVLEDAIRRYQRYAHATNRHGRRMFREVAEWITEHHAGGEPSFTFEYVCAVLGLDPNYLREGLQRWVQAGAYRSRPARSALPLPMPSVITPDRGNRA